VEGEFSEVRENLSFGVCAGALLGNTISSLLSRVPPHPPPRNGDPAFLFMSGGRLDRGIGPKCVLRLAYPVRAWGSIGAQPDVNLGGGVGLCIFRAGTSPTLASYKRDVFFARKTGSSFLNQGRIEDDETQNT
jgi:hypothetical protein